MAKHECKTIIMSIPGVAPKFMHGTRSEGIPTAWYNYCRECGRSTKREAPTFSRRIDRKAN